MFLTLGALTVGCTNGPQKSTGFGANTQPIGSKSTQMASQQPQSFPLANGQNANFNVPPQKQPGLPQINPPTNQFQSTGNTSSNPNPLLMNGGGLGSQNQLEKFEPMNRTGSQSFPQGGNVTPIGAVNNQPSPVMPNTGSFGDQRVQSVRLESLTYKS
jgi:hypothetical protein